MWSQNATANINRKSRSNPYVYTEQGTYMLATVLKNDIAVTQSIIVELQVKMRVIKCARLIQ